MARALHSLLAGSRPSGGPPCSRCSALRQAYRDRIAAGIPDLRIVYLRGDPALLARRLADRRGHYMPAALLTSQLETLEEPRDALALEVTAPPEVIADRIRIGLGARPARPTRPTSSDAGGPPGPPEALEVIRTARLVLTRIADDDFGDLCRMHRDPEVMRTLGGVRSDELTVEVLRQLTTHWTSTASATGWAPSGERRVRRPRRAAPDRHRRRAGGGDRLRADAVYGTRLRHRAGARLHPRRLRDARAPGMVA